MDAQRKSGEESTDVGIGPYKATKLWNDVITAFRQGVPRGKHRRYMRTAENCFVGSAAVDWLYEYLKKDVSIGKDVTRQQATQLLNKFYKAGIFEEIQVSRRGRNKHDFSDSSRLYRLLPASPSKGTRTPLAVRPLSSFNIPANVPASAADKPPKGIKHRSGYKVKARKAADEGTSKEEKNEAKSGRLTVDALPQCHLVGRILTFSEISEVWKTAALSRLKKVLGRSNLEDILQGYAVNGGYIRHNCIFLNKSGIVTNIAPEDHLPHWVLSAMKCLARWPEKVEGDLPSYPGFEKDVFGVVRDYFLGLPEPLITQDLYDVVTNVYVQACNQLPRHSSPYAHASGDRSRLRQSLWSATSLENIILNLTRKYCMTDSRTDLCGLTDSRPDLFNPADACSEWSRTRSHADLGRLANSRSDLRGTTYSESDYFHPSKSHTDLYGMDVHGGESRGDVFRMVESCGDLRLHGGQSTSDLHVVPERLGVSTMSAFPSSLARSSGFGQLDADGRKRFHSTPELQVAHYETAFGPENQTVTRVYYCNGVSTDYQHGTSHESDFYSPVETHFDIDPDKSKPQQSADHISFERVNNRSGNLSSSCDHSRSTAERSRSFNRITETSRAYSTSRGRLDNVGNNEIQNPEEAWSTVPRSVPQRRSRAERYNTMGGAEFVFGASEENRKLGEMDRYLSVSSPYLPYADEEEGPILRHRGTSTTKSSSVSTLSKRSSSLFMNFPQSGLCEERATKALQIVFLFLPPASRRKLHFLMKLLSKMAANPFLTLDPSQSTRSLVLGTFQRAVLRSGEEADLDEVLMLQLMSFLLDHHMDILAVPTDMKEGVEERLKTLQKPQIVYSPRETEEVRFCQPMSVQQYEAESQDQSQKALADLLDNIVRDQNMQEKDRRRHLKQFQRTYPQIYKKRFPSADSDPLQTEARPPIKPPLLAKPLMKLRGLRV